MSEHQKIGPYDVLEDLGEGSFGPVYAGRQGPQGRPVAIKVCALEDSDLRQRFVREAEAAAKLEHPNIAATLAVGSVGSMPYLAQELISGPSLGEILGNREETPLAARLESLLMIARGLDHAHRHGVWHGDLTPNNIRRGDQGLKILDFGTARLASSETRLTQKGVTVESASYLPPEQVRGGELDHRVDLFSLGVLAFEILTHERPFRGKTLSALVYQILYKEPADILGIWPECPPALEALISRCLAKEPDQRHGSVAEVIAELEAIRGGEAGSSPAPAPPQPPTREVVETTKPIPTLGRKPGDPVDTKPVVARPHETVRMQQIPEEKVSTTMPLPTLGGEKSAPPAGAARRPPGAGTQPEDPQKTQRIQAVPASEPPRPQDPQKTQRVAIPDGAPLKAVPPGPPAARKGPVTKPPAATKPAAGRPGPPPPPVPGAAKGEGTKAQPAAPPSSARPAAPQAATPQPATPRPAASSQPKATPSAAPPPAAPQPATPTQKGKRPGGPGGAAAGTKTPGQPPAAAMPRPGSPVDKKQPLAEAGKTKPEPAGSPAGPTPKKEATGGEVKRKESKPPMPPPPAVGGGAKQSSLRGGVDSEIPTMPMSRATPPPSAPAKGEAPRPPAPPSGRPPSGPASDEETPADLATSAHEISQLVAKGNLQEAMAQLETIRSQQGSEGEAPKASGLADAALGGPGSTGPKEPKPEERTLSREAVASPPTRHREPRKGPPMWMLVAGGVAVLLAVVAIGWFLAGGGAPEEPEEAVIPEPPKPRVETPTDVAAPPPTGWVSVDALPWGEVVEITNADGYLLDLPEVVHTPLILALEPGLYRIQLASDSAPEPSQCEVEVTLDVPTVCRVSFPTAEALEYFKDTGWWK